MGTSSKPLQPSNTQLQPPTNTTTSNLSSWSLSSRVPTTSLRPSRALSLVLPRRPTRKSPRIPTPVGTRMSAAKDALGDKADESSHDAKADAHKEIAKN